MERRLKVPRGIGGLEGGRPDYTMRLEHKLQTKGVGHTSNTTCKFCLIYCKFGSVQIKREVSLCIPLKEPTLMSGCTLHCTVSVVEEGMKLHIQIHYIIRTAVMFITPFCDRLC